MSAKWAYVIFALHSVVCLACMGAMLTWPSYHESLLSPRSACLVASLWRRRFHDSSEVLLLLSLVCGCVAVFDMVPGSRHAQSALDAFASGAEARLPETGCLQGSGAVHVLAAQPVQWLPPVPVLARLAAPPAECLERCEAFLRDAAWEPSASISEGRGGDEEIGIHAFLARMFGVGMAFTVGTRIASLAFRASDMWHLPADSIELAEWAFQVRWELSLVTVLHVGLATLRSVVYLGLVLGPEQFRVVTFVQLLLVNFALELAWYPMAVLPAYYAKLLIGVALELLELFAGLLRHALSVAWELLEVVLKEIVVEFHMELSLPETRSRGDDLCAICLSPLHPEATLHQEPNRVVLSSVERLRPRFRARCSQMSHRFALVRFSRCGHAFHRSCFLECAAQASHTATCATCRTEFVRLEWRRQLPLWLLPLLEYVDRHVDSTAVCRAAAVAAAVGLCFGLRGRAPLNVASVEVAS